MSVASPAPCAFTDYPLPCPLLEDVAASPSDRAAAFGFALSRCVASRPILVVLPRRERTETGRPSLHGISAQLPGVALLLALPPDTATALWTMEQALRSGALGGVIGWIEGATLTQTRRLDFAAATGGATGIVLTSRPAGLSAARRRWRIAAAPSSVNLHDARAPGHVRLVAELVRRRDGAPGSWLLEQGVAGGLAVAARLGADGTRTVTAGLRAA